MTDGPVGVRSALDLISSSTIKSRSDGISELRQIFRHTGQAAKLEELDDRVYHEVLETLFHCVEIERSAFLKAKKDVLRNSAAGRLSLCASTVRLIVEAGVRRISIGTVKAILDHIIESLPHPEGGQCEPLVEDYAKALCAILDSPVHVEHLKEEKWINLVEFCLDAIKLHIHSVEASKGITSNGNSHNGAVASSARMSRSFASQTGPKGGPSAGTAADFVMCVRRLVQACNSPLVKLSADILDMMLFFVRSIQAVSRGHHDAFATIGHVMSRIRNERTDVARDFLTSFLPVLRGYWVNKRSSIREELITIMVYSEDHIVSMSLTAAGSVFTEELERLRETMLAEYLKRQEKDMLHIDDITLRLREKRRRTRLRRPNTCCLELKGLRSEEKWMTVYFISSFSAALDRSRALAARDHLRCEDDDVVASDRHVRKRQRPGTLFEDYLRQLTHASSSACTGYLQVLTFMLDVNPVEAVSLDEAIQKLSPGLGHASNAVSAWTMLCLTSSALQKEAKLAMLKASWLALSKVTARSLPHAAHSRPASLLLNTLLSQGLLDHGVVSGIVESMFSAIDLNGPGKLTESSIDLWTTALQFRHAENPSSSSHDAEQILRWMFSRWRPSENIDRGNGARDPQAFDATDLVSLLHACLGSPSPDRTETIVCVQGPLSQARTRVMRSARLSSYLLHGTEDEAEQSQSPPGGSPSATTPEAGSSKTTEAHLGLAELMLAESRNVRNIWNDSISDRLQLVSPDAVHEMTKFIVVATAATELEELKAQPRLDLLRKAIAELSDQLGSALAAPQCSQDRIDACLLVMTERLPDPAALPTLGLQEFKRLGVFPLAADLLKALDERKSLGTHSTWHDSYDTMDVDHDFESQPLRMSNSNYFVDNFRDDVSASSDITTLRACVELHCHLAVCARMAPSAERSASSLPAAFVDHVLTLPPSELYASRPLLTALILSDLSFLGATRYLEHLAEVFLQEYDFERCEVAILCCLEALRGLAKHWAQPDADADDIGGQIFEWALKNILRPGIASAQVQISFADLCSTLSELQYPSARTTVFDLFTIGDCFVKYHTAKLIGHIFSRWKLSEHDTAFEDLQHNHLPNDLSQKEEIAMRLFVLAEMAAKWQTVRRKCVYHIYETAAAMEAQARIYATRSIEIVTARLKLQDSRDLFRLFAPQILYTWLDDERVETVPFEIFGYGSLSSLIVDVEPEVVAQLLMRQKLETLSSVSKLTDKPVDRLLADSFAKSAAYAISWDVVSAAKGLAKERTSESLLMSILGKDEYLRMFQAHFHEIIGTVVCAAGELEQVSRAFAKKPSYESEARTLDSIEALCSSQMPLPASQQPNFPGKYLLDQLERACRRNLLTTAKLWSTSRYVYAFRTIVDQMDPALGSLFACASIRKLRVLIAMAGPVALEGYALEMALHALRPYLTDQQSADDTIGVLRYLCDNGKTASYDRLSCFAGSATAMLLSTGIFQHAAQDSTTQDSQHHASKQNTASFRVWLSSFLLDFASRVPETSQRRRFRSLVQTATESAPHGSAELGSAAGNLLLELLNDGAVRPVSLLEERDRSTLFGLLQASFDRVPSSASDIIATDSTAEAFAPQLWEFVNRSDYSESFSTWATRALGRAFDAGSGSRSILRSMMHRGPSANPSEDAFTALKDPYQKSTSLSRARIIDHVRSTLRSPSAAEVGAAEETLRRCIAGAHNDVEARHCIEVCVPQIIQLALHLPDRSRQQPQVEAHGLQDAGLLESGLSPAEWTSRLCLALAMTKPEDVVLGPVVNVLKAVPDASSFLFPSILHLALLADLQADRNVERAFSAVCRAWFKRDDVDARLRNRMLLNGLLYMRRQPIPFEVTSVDRDKWLDVDPLEAAGAACRCGMYSTALLFVERRNSQKAKSSKRPSTSDSRVVLNQLLQEIYQNLDDPDSFYGLSRSEGLDSLLERLDYEGDGYRSLLFRGARLDNHLRKTGQLNAANANGIIHSLMDLNLTGLAYSAISSSRMGSSGSNMVDDALDAARKLQQWDVQAPATTLTPSSVLYEAFQAVRNADSRCSLRYALDKSFGRGRQLAIQAPRSFQDLVAAFSSLAALFEMDETLSVTSCDDLHEVCAGYTRRHKTMNGSRFADLRPILSSRQTLFNMLARSATLQRLVGTGPRDAAILQVEVLLTSTSVARSHGAANESLTTATQLHDMVQDCRAIGLNIDAIADFEIARVLWDQGEQHSSIRILQELATRCEFDKQSAAPQLSKVFANIARQVAEARLEQPQEIMKNYLRPAVDALKDKRTGDAASDAFHEFASFCDRQLHQPARRDDFIRVEKLRRQRQEEAAAYKEQAKASKDRVERHRLGKSYEQARRWLKLDDEEFHRLRTERETFIELSIQNYMHALEASDAHNDDMLRFVTVWFEFADTPLANEVVAQSVEHVPSYKFTTVMNQLSSRLQAGESRFQSLLASLVARVCTDHPYHGMYQMYSGASPKGIRDDLSKSRQEATHRLASRFKQQPRASGFWKAIQSAHSLYDQSAVVGGRNDFSSGEEYKLEEFPVTREMARKIPKLKMPPITLHVEARSDMDYSKLPHVHHFKPTMKIAGGLSKPKIITAVASDGRYFRQLLKGGSDDLRQDAIMEQVFEQVSGFLRRHPATQQRDLLVRTYKVIPLSAVSGVIEFVPNTMPINDVLLPMHDKYHPKDMKYSSVRQKVGNAKDDSTETRIKTFRECAERFQPAMHFWFLENFLNPDEWFERRLAYTRSVAASSILGYVLGLGDRHLHNILMDRKSGEVVHIDLGVAFEAGRVLPIPEIIPFRLTRDMVDGMGYTKTEGVFRRCCEFTLDALREERESMMTVLNVLRYDPLCTWTVSPLRAKKMQDEIDEEEAAVAPDAIAEQASKRDEDEAGEAGRALTVIEKKLSKTLSTAATVNELIQQAIDDRNLALLFVGWSAWV